MMLQERHKIQYLFSSALLFLILGLGNVIYGHAKYKEYKGIFKETALEINKETDSQSNIDLESSSLLFDNSFNEKTRHLKRSHGRIIFYQFFVTGGKVLLGISLLLFIIFFTTFLFNKNNKLKDNK